MNTEPKQYIFSYTVQTQHPVIKRRPWWAIFGRDKIDYISSHERVYLMGLSEKEANSISALFFGSPKSLIGRLLDSARDFQLEPMNKPSSPILSYGHANLIRNSNPDAP